MDLGPFRQSHNCYVLSLPLPICCEGVSDIVYGPEAPKKHLKQPKQIKVRVVMWSSVTNNIIMMTCSAVFVLDTDDTHAY